MTIQERVQLLAGAQYDSKIIQQLMDEAVRLVIGELPEEVLESLQVEETDDGTNGVSVVGKRLIRAHKDGYPARYLDSYLRARITSETSYYEAESYQPAYYTYGGKAYVKPSGGIVVTVTPPAVAVSSTTVTGVEESLLDLFISRCAMLVLTEIMKKEREKISTTVTLPSVPASLIPPAFVYLDAASVAPSATLIDPLPDPELYFGPTAPSLPTEPVVGTLDLSGITVPTPPVLGDITYVPVEVSEVADVQIDPLPTLPSFSAPVFGGDLSLPALPTLSFTTDVTGGSITSPVVPASPAVGYYGAVASTIGSTAVGVLPAAPLPPSAVFEGDIGKITASLPASFTSSASPPSAPTLGEITYVAPQVLSLASTSIPALPTPPTFGAVVFEGDLASITSGLPSSFVTTANPPIIPALPSLSYTAVVGPVVVGATIGSLPAVPTYSAPSYTGTPDSILDEIPVMIGDSDLTVPTAPTAPSLTYPGVVLGSIAATSIGSFPTPPSITDIAFEGDISSIGAGLPADIDLTTDVDSNALTPPSPPTAPDISYVEPYISGGATPSITAPSSLDPYQPPLIELDWSGFDTYAASIREDPEMMAAHVAKARADIEKNTLHIQNAQAEFQEAMETFREEANRNMEEARLLNEYILRTAQYTSELNVRVALDRIQGGLRVYELELQAFQIDLALYREKVDTKLKQYQFNLELATRAIAEREALYLQKYQEDLRQRQTQFQGDVQSHLREVEVLITQAQLDQQRLIAEYQTQADTRLKDAIQQVQLDLAIYQGQLEGYRADAEVYATTMNGRYQQMQGNIARVSQGFAEAERVKIQKYSADIQAALGEFQSETVLWREQVQQLIAQAQLDHAALELQVRDAKSVELQNAIQQAQMDIAEFQAYLQQYEVSARVYQYQVEGEVAAFRANLELAVGPIQAQQRLYVEKYLADTNRAAQEFQGEMQDHMAEVQRLIRQAEITAEELRTEFTVNTQADLQRAIQATQAEVEKYGALLRKYESEATVYRTTVEGEVAEFRANLELATGPVQAEQALYVQKYQQDLGNDIQRFNGQIQEYLKEIDTIVEDARLAQERLIQQAGLETNVEVQNAQQEAAVALQNYGMELQRLQSSVVTWQTQINTVIEAYQAQLRGAIEPWATQQRLQVDLYSQDIQKDLSEYQAVVQDHLREIDRVMRQADMNLQRLSLNAQMLNSQGLQNETNQLQAQIASYRQKLELFQAEIALYRSEVEAAVQEFSAGLSMEIRAFEAIISGRVRIFESEVQTARADWEARFGVYQSAVQRNALAAQIAQQEAQQTAAQATEVDIANKARQLEAAISLYQANLGKHREDLEAYNAEVQSTLAKYQAEHAVRQDLLRAINYDMSRISTRYNETKAAYMRFYWPHRSYTVRQPVM